MIELSMLRRQDTEYPDEQKEYHSDVWDTKVISNIAKASMEVFLPDSSIATGTAVVIAPGGCLYALSIESEGRDVARWLVKKGVAAFVLRYRLVPTEGESTAQVEKEWNADPKALVNRVQRTLPYSIADGLTAISYVRENAKAFAVLPNKIGLMGFSAGGTVVLGVNNQYLQHNRPDFMMLVYPWTDPLDIKTPKQDAPPLILICATDDEFGLAKDAINLYNSYFDRGKNVSLSMYSRGGHGFGMRKQGLASDKWIERAYEWLWTESWIPPISNNE